MFDDFSEDCAYNPYFDDESDLGDDGGPLEEYPAYGAEADPDIGEDFVPDEPPGTLPLRLRLRDFAPYMDDPLEESMWKNESEDSLLGLVLEGVADRRLGGVAAACAEEAAEIFSEADRLTRETVDGWGLPVTKGRRCVLWERAFADLCCIQRRLRQCRRWRGP